MTGLWRATEPVILASQSQARQALLGAADIPFKACASQVDERKMEAALASAGAGASDVALQLSRAKALAVSARWPGRLVIGADQVLCLEGQLFAKPANAEEAIAQLQALSGRVHELHSGCSVVRDDAILFETVSVARLSCRPLSQIFIKTYAEQGGVDSTGVYRIEGLGIHLFDAIEGDHATILGLPLLAFLKFLREEGSLLS